MNRLKFTILTLAMVIAMAFTASAQKNDPKDRPPKDKPPTVNPGPKDRPPRGNPPPKDQRPGRPGFSFAIVPGKESENV